MFDKFNQEYRNNITCFLTEKSKQKIEKVEQENKRVTNLILLF